MALSKKVKFGLSLASSLIFFLCTEVLLATAGLNVYIMSYIHEKQNWVKMSYCNYIYPVVWSAQSFFVIFSGEAEKIFRPKGTMIVGTIIMQISLVGLFFQQNIYLLFPLLIIYSLGAGISLNIPGKNALFYYPKYVGIISSSEIVFQALSAGFFALLGEYIINPDKKLVNPISGFYDLEISQRSKYFFLATFVASTIGNYLAVICYQQYIPAIDGDEEEKNKLKEIILNKKKEKKVLLNSISNSRSGGKLSSIEMSATETLKETSSDLKKIFSTIRIYRNLYLNAGSVFWLYFLATTFRNYISQVNFDGNIQKYLFTLSDVAQMISSPLWGLYVDKHTFGQAILIINIASAATCLFMIFTIQYQYCFAFSVLVMTTVFAGIEVAVPTHVFEIYGIRNMLFLEGLITFSQGIIHILGAVLSVVLEKICGAGENLTPGYRYTFIGLFLLSVTGFPVACFEGEEEFDFSNKPKKEEVKYEKPTEHTLDMDLKINNIEGSLEPNDGSDNDENEDNKEDDKDEEKIDEVKSDKKKNEESENENKKEEIEVKNDEKKEVKIEEKKEGDENKEK